MSQQRAAKATQVKLKVREFDIVVYGATGFTGKLVAKYLTKAAAANKARRKAYKWAIAGRTKHKLEGVLKQLRQEADKEAKLDAVRIIVARTGDPDSLKKMCARTRVLINCVGPFRFHGEPVVKSCVAMRTHYVDITGEPEFMARMAVKYHSEAEQNGTCIVHACGFDSIPADLGMLYVTKHYQSIKTVLSCVESVLTVKGASSANVATWNSLVHGLGSVKQMRHVRRQLRAQRVELQAKHEEDSQRKQKQELKQERKKQKRVQFVRTGKRYKHRSLPFKHALYKKWCMLFMGSDSSVVRNSHELMAIEQNALTKDGTPYYGAYFSVPSFFYIIPFFIMGLFLFLLTKCGWGRKILLKFPGLFSFGMFKVGGPAKAQLEKGSFHMDFYCWGANKKDFVHARVSGPEPGYISTSIFVVQSALVLLEERVRDV